MAKIQRTFGWIQNPGELSKLRKVVASLCPNTSEHNDLVNVRLPLLKLNGFISNADYNRFVSLLSGDSFPYEDLKGKGAGKSGRKNALCTGIIQAILDAQKHLMVMDLDGNSVDMNKPYTDDWTSDGFLRWAISVGFIDYDVNTDTCTVSDIGKKLASTVVDSSDEKNILGDALLTYPPALKVLELIATNTTTAMTKFEIGSQLGFKGEMGFTSIPQEQYVANLCEALTQKEKTEIRQNMEGDSDKYARMIAGWLAQLGWVTKTSKSVTETFLGKTYSNVEIGQAFMITISGLNALKKANGYSKYPRLPRRVLFQMLASKASGVDFLRKRRAGILKALSTSMKSLTDIKSYLATIDVDTTEDTIKDDIIGLNNIGISIKCNDDKYRLEDTIIGLEIPKEKIVADNIIELKDAIAKKLKHIDHRYLILVDYAYSDKKGAAKNADARQFEIETANLFTKELSFEGERLGDSDKPDVIIYYAKNGTIIDNKSYKEGFSVDKHCADEMHRYIVHNRNRTAGIPKNEWWKNFGADVTNFTFLFITSKLVGNYKKNLEELSANSGIKGGAISVDNLLYLSDKLKNNDISYDSFFDMMQNDEITVAV